MSHTLCAETIASALRLCHQPATIYIGYSGGVDSHVLLHLAATTEIKDRITAVYVHHGLQAVAESWAEHCAATAKALGVKFKLLRVNAQPIQGESPEEAARNARYAAFKSLMGTGDVLMVAQHREDQLETVLLQLLRGSGLKGLSAMPEMTAFGDGILLRPLLNTAKSAIDSYAQTHALDWVHDPTNLCDDYDRNFLRNSVVPLLKQRWPQCDKTVARSAQHCADGQQLISKLAEQLLLPLYNPADQTLCISRLLSHDAKQQALIIRQWLQLLGLKMPALAFIGRLQAEILGARPDSDPVLACPAYSIRRYRDKLYCLQSSQGTFKAIVWPANQPVLRLAPGVQLAYVPSSAGLLRSQWQQAEVTVKPRTGGETIRLPKRHGHHALKKLFQEADIPPWQRLAMPLIYMDGQLAAVGDLWISADFYCESVDGCVSFTLH
ncbi:MAG: tRNA lysidine(34) synthetase TilS [Methylococcales bacterium]|nr:tRNA lysidine(34) synthetase TilS [Methylococcales bacterium]